MFEIKEYFVQDFGKLSYCFKLDWLLCVFKRKIHRTFATGAASKQETLTRPFTWFVPLEPLFVLNWDQSLLNLSCFLTLNSFFPQLLNPILLQGKGDMTTWWLLGHSESTNVSDSKGDSISLRSISPTKSVSSGEQTTRTSKTSTPIFTPVESVVEGNLHLKQVQIGIKQFKSLQVFTLAKKMFKTVIEYHDHGDK